MGKTVVVGGGTSGLAAAYTLENAGADCLVLEKRDFTGGRISSAVREGFTLDLGAQFFFKRYHATFELMEKLGIKDQLVWFKLSVGILRDGTVRVLNTDIKHNLRNPSEALEFNRLLSRRGKGQAVRLALKLFGMRKKLDFIEPLKAIELDNISIAEYIRKNFTEELLEYVFQPGISALTLGQPESVSAAYGLGLLWYATGGLGTLKKGIGFLAESMANNISKIKLKTEVTRVVLDSNRVKGVEAAAGGKLEFIEADNVICATTANVASRLLGDLPEAMTGILESINYSSSVNVMFALPEKPLGDVFGIATPRREGLCIPGFIENANKYPRYAPPNSGIMHTFTFGEFSDEMLEWDGARIQERTTREIQKTLPRFPDRPIFCEIFRWPEAVCLSSPGQIAAVQRLKKRLGDYRGLYLAGGYLGMPSVESAIHSGVQAAKSLLSGGPA